MTNATIATKYGTNPRNTWDGTEKIPLDVGGADGVGLASTLKAYVLAAPLTITGVANTSVLTSTGYSLTAANAQSMIDLAGTWNTSGNPVALKIAITNTASGATSKFTSFLAGAAGATEVAYVDKAGNNFAQAFAVAGPTNPFSWQMIFAYPASETVIIKSYVQDVMGFNGQLKQAYMNSGISLAWNSTAALNTGASDLYLSRRGAANLQLGRLDAAAPVAQSLSVQSVVAGTSNTAGVDTNITGSLSTGSGIAGKIKFNVSQIVAAATTQNAASTVLALNTVAASGVQFPQYGAGALSTDASGNITATSDERLKHVTGHFKAGLAELMKIDPIVFKWREDSGMETAHEYVGFGAHNVQESMPEAVGQTPDGYLTLSDRALLAACVNAIKDLSERLHK